MVKANHALSNSALAANKRLFVFSFVPSLVESLNDSLFQPGAWFVGSLVRSFIRFFIHLLILLLFILSYFFSFNFRSRTLLLPRRDLWKRKRCWSRHRRGTDRLQRRLWQPLRKRAVRWYFMSVAQSVHLRSNGLQRNELNQGLSEFNWPITAFVRNEGGCSKIVDGPGCFRCTVSIDELSNQSMN